jgi:hypothetical protein
MDIAFIPSASKIFWSCFAKSRFASFDNPYRTRFEAISAVPLMPNCARCSVMPSSGMLKLSGVLKRIPEGGSACVEDDTVITRTSPPDCDAFFLRSGRSVVVRTKGPRWLRALIARMRDGGGI